MPLFLRAFGFVFFVAVAKADSTTPTECQMWNDVSNSAMEQEFLNVNCEKNTFCTGFSCAGTLLFQNGYVQGRESFGFTIEFIPCSYPLMMHLRINSTDMLFSELVGVHGRNEKAAALVYPGIGDVEEPYGRLNLVWNAVLKPVKYFVTLQINFTRITVSGEFPPLVLVPKRNYPIPNCQYSVSSKPKFTASGKECSGSECEDKEESTVATKLLDTGFVVKTCVIVGSVLVTLCFMAGLVFMRHHQRSIQGKNLIVEGESDEEDESASYYKAKGHDSGDDSRNLLRV